MQKFWGSRQGHLPSELLARDHPAESAPCDSCASESLILPTGLVSDGHQLHPLHYTAASSTCAQQKHLFLPRMGRHGRKVSQQVNLQKTPALGIQM